MRPRFVAFVALLFASAARVPAAGQELPAITDVPALRTDNFVLVPSGLFSGGHDSNIHREGPPNGPIGSVETFGVAGLQSFGQLSSLVIRTMSGAELVSFKDHPGEGGLSWANRAILHLDRPRFRPKGNVRYSDTYARPTGFEIGERSRHQEFAYGGGMDVRLNPRATIGGDVNHLSLNYDADAVYDGSNLYQTLSLELTVEGGEFRYELSPLTTMSLRLSADQTRFRLDHARDTDAGVATVGFTMARPAMISGSGQVGLRWFKSLQGNADTFVGLIGSGNFAYTRPSGLIVIGRFDRDSQFSYDTALAYYVFTDLGTTVAYKPGGWNLGAGASHQWLDYRYAGTAAGAGRVDHRTAVGAVVAHRVGRGMELGVNADYITKTGKLAFNATRAMVYWSLGSAFLMRFDRPLPGEMP